MKKFNLRIYLITVWIFSIHSLNGQWLRTNGTYDHGPFGADVNCLTFSDSKIYAGTNGGLYLSTDTGQSWARLNSLYTASIFVQGAVIYTGVYSGGIYKSLDSGATWKAADSGMSVNAVYSLVTIDSIIYAANWGGGVYMSKDSGKSWNPIDNGLPTYYTYASSLAVIGTDLIVSIPSSCNLSTGVFLTSNDYIWNDINNGLPDSVINSLFVNGTNIFARTDSILFLSSNYGSSWSKINNGLQNTSVSSFTSIGSNVFVGTYGKGVFFSNNNGGNWVPVTMGLTDLNIISLTVGDGYIFAGDDSGTVWKRPLLDILTTVKNETNNNFDISIYPNPATNQFTIHTSLKDEHATVEIYNVMGQMASSPAPLLQERGAVLIDVSKLNSGIYFIKINSEVQQSQMVAKFVKE